MTAPRVRRPVLRATGLAAVAAALAVVACAAPVPTQPSTGGARQLAGTEGSFVRTPLTPRSLLERYYPNVLADGMPANDIILFVFDGSGAVISHEYLAAPPAEGNATKVENPLLQRAMRNTRPDEIHSVNVIKSQPGELAPTGVQLVLVQKKSTNGEPTVDIGAALTGVPANAPPSETRRPSNR